MGSRAEEVVVSILDPRSSLPLRLKPSLTSSVAILCEVYPAQITGYYLAGT